MRKYLRAIARARMQEQGIERLNKPVIIKEGKKLPGRSFFARNWRMFTSAQPAKRKRLRTA